jgi:hypothetical protein
VCDDGASEWNVLEEEKPESAVTREVGDEAVEPPRSGVTSRSRVTEEV